MKFMMLLQLQVANSLACFAPPYMSTRSCWRSHARIGGNGIGDKSVKWTVAWTFKDTNVSTDVLKQCGHCLEPALAPPFISSPACLNSLNSPFDPTGRAVDVVLAVGSSADLNRGFGFRQEVQSGGRWRQRCSSFRASRLLSGTLRSRRRERERRPSLAARQTGGRNQGKATRGPGRPVNRRRRRRRCVTVNLFLCLIGRYGFRQHVRTATFSGVPGAVSKNRNKAFFDSPDGRI